MLGKTPPDRHALNNVSVSVHVSQRCGLLWSAGAAPLSVTKPGDSRITIAVAEVRNGLLYR